MDHSVEVGGVEVTSVELVIDQPDVTVVEIGIRSNLDHLVESFFAQSDEDRLSVGLIAHPRKVKLSVVGHPTTWVTLTRTGVTNGPFPSSDGSYDVSIVSFVGTDSVVRVFAYRKPRQIDARGQVA